MTSNSTTGALRIQDEAPDFEANTTAGNLRLSGFTDKGKWVTLFSYPADFTPVCGSEIVNLARRQREFESRNVQLLGLSTDSLEAHQNWARDMKAGSGVEIAFPIIADPERKIARTYGMIHDPCSDTVAIRAVFVIDPARKIRALMYYPMQMGRSVDELLRVVDALQTIDKSGGFLPCDWVPGQPGIAG
jgi:peroxiredoxin (alkyl hydroperoxide reductase subunit C)